MGDKATPGFTADDRKVLNQLPVVLQNINEKIDSIGTRISRVEEQKANRAELVDLERQIVSKLDSFRDWIIKVEKEKADRAEVPVADVGDHEKRIRDIEQKTSTLPDALSDIKQLNRWRWSTVGYASAFSVMIAVISWIIEVLTKH